MIQLILEFYIPAFFITLVLALVISLLSLVIYLLRKKSHHPVRRQQFIHDLLVTNLITIPVVSFALLALLVILRAR